MYKIIVRPILFCLNPETAHHLIFSMLRIIGFIPGLLQLIRFFNSVKSSSLEREFFGIKFPNPVGLAAGLDKDAKAFRELSAFGFGFIEIGTVTPKPQTGNPKPRLFRLVKDQALINRMGFNNLGVEQAIERLKDRNNKIIIGGNIGKNTTTANEDAIHDYVFCFNALHEFVDYFVVNVSCPNIKDLHKLQDKDSLVAILNKLQEINNIKKKPKPILLKIAPDLNQEQLDEIIEITETTKIDGIVATNTTTTRKGLSLTEDEILKIGNGGLSGKPLQNRSNEVIRYLRQKLGRDFPIIGVGGIIKPEDAIEKLKAGASLVQIYSGFIYEGPGLVKRICREMC